MSEVRLIDANALIEVLKENEWITDDPFADGGGLDDLINEMPTVDIEKLGESLNCQIRAHYGSCDDCMLSCPRNELIKLLGLARPQGEWIKGEEIAKTKIGDKEFSEYRDFTCSNCGITLNNLLYWSDGSPFYKFCPNCGARMKGGAEE